MELSPAHRHRFWNVLVGSTLCKLPSMWMCANSRPPGTHSGRDMVTSSVSHIARVPCNPKLVAHSSKTSREKMRLYNSAMTSGVVSALSCWCGTSPVVTAGGPSRRDRVRKKESVPEGSHATCSDTGCKGSGLPPQAQMTSKQTVMARVGSGVLRCIRRLTPRVVETEGPSTG